MSKKLCFFLFLMVLVVMAPGWGYEISPHLRLNGLEMGQQVWLTPRDSFYLDLSLETDTSQPADWWLIVQSPYGPFCYDAYLGRWRPWDWQTSPSYQGPVVSFQGFSLPVSGLPVGSYTVCFGVDLKANGQLDLEDLYPQCLVLDSRQAVQEVRGLVSRDGHPVAGARVFVLSPRGISTFSGSDGTFRLFLSGPALAGRYLLVADGGDLSGLEAVDLEASGETTLKALELQEGPWEEKAYQLLCQPEDLLRQSLLSEMAYFLLGTQQAGSFLQDELRGSLSPSPLVLEPQETARLQLSAPALGRNQLLGVFQRGDLALSGILSLLGVNGTLRWEIEDPRVARLLSAGSSLSEGYAEIQGLQAGQTRLRVFLEVEALDTGVQMRVSDGQKTCEIAGDARRVFETGEILLAEAEIWVKISEMPPPSDSPGEIPSEETEVLWFEDWERSPEGRYTNGQSFPGQMSRWEVLDSSGLEGCSYLKAHEAVIGPAQSPHAQGRSLTLYSYQSDASSWEWMECGDNVEVYTYLDLQLTPNTYFSACFSGYLTGSEDESAIYILFEDQRGNELLYILNYLAEEWEPDLFCWNDEDLGERCVQIKVDLDGGCFTTNLYQDFARMEGLDPSQVRLRFIELMVDEHGVAEFDQLVIYRR